MKHKATKVMAGEYTYRGYYIEHCEGLNIWVIGELNDDQRFGKEQAHDAADTLKESKEIVDYYHSK